MSAALFCLTVAAAAAPLWWPLDVINQLTPVLTAASAVMVLVSLRLPVGQRRAAVAGFAAASLLIGGFRLLSPFVGLIGTAPAPCGPDATRLLTQNIWAVNQQPQLTAESIVASGADIVVLQEVKDSGLEVVRLLRGLYPHVADCSAASEWCRLAVLSRRPIRDWTYHHRNTRASPPQIASWITARVDTDQGPLTVVSTHLLHFERGARPALERLQLSKTLGASNRDRMVIAGDFNLTPWTSALKRIDSTLRMRRVTPGPTWPARLSIGGRSIRTPFAIWPIDHVYVGSAWRVCEARTSPVTGSDHLGVMVGLAPL